MKKRLYFLLLLAIITPLLVYPCRCNEVSVIDGIKHADIVFKGTVLSVIKATNYEDVGLKIDTTGLDNMAKQIKFYVPLFYVTIKIEKLYKGNDESNTIRILTPVSGASCGYRYFEEGQEHIVYDNKEDYFSKLKLPMKPLIYPESNLYWTNHCTRTTYWYKEEEDNILNVLQTLK